MMYYYWKTRGIRPATFYNMPHGELLVVRAFYLQELEERQEKIREYNEGEISCPFLLGL